MECLLAILTDENMNTDSTDQSVKRFRVSPKWMTVIVLAVCVGIWLATRWFQCHAIIRLCNCTETPASMVSLQVEDGRNSVGIDVGPLLPGHDRWVALKCSPRWHCAYALSVRFDTDRAFVTEQRLAESGRFGLERIGSNGSEYK